MGAHIPIEYLLTPELNLKLLFVLVGVIGCCMLLSYVIERTKKEKK